MLLITLFFLSLLCFSVSTAMAYTPKGKGAPVCKEVGDQINGLGIFPNDHKFLCRVAWVESKYAEAPGTYRAGYHGGMWQVTSVFASFDARQVWDGR